MRKMLLTIFILLPVTVFAHDYFTLATKEIVKQSQVIAVGEVIKKTTDKQRCKTTTTYRIKIKRFLKGTTEKKTIHFYYTIFHWKKAAWFWQDDCPSVNYRLPPKPENIKEGTEVILSIQRNKDQLIATGTFDLSQKSEITKMLNFLDGL